ncbi:hypothetical protein J0676_09135 [Vibrio sp. Vb2880]|uniref:hypothetical protein n=1 Tax=Vibrio TaxID=662 RepID=UPI00117F1F97|nr:MULTISPECIES: hypothetical protein [Vibrio]MBO0213657.1 hypothetical protein [Vibrio sp. Vb2880]TRN24331.1 hypothetical protein DM784_08335 [Vibrio furnissii]UHJ63100.1 hypothetical protein LUM42_19035 [Vibrio furnissii]
MNDLHLYVAAMLDSTPALTIAERTTNEDTTQDDQGERLYTREQTVTFTNGVVIHQSIEQAFDVQPNDAVCAECWISYRVVSEPETMNITPKRKHFINACQQAFWLNIRRAQQ